MVGYVFYTLQKWAKLFKNPRFRAKNLLHLLTLCRLGKQNADNGDEAKHDGIIYIRYNMQRIQGCQTCRHEQLCAVWNQSLHNTGEDIQKTRGAARSNLIAACNCSHDFSDGKDGNRVVAVQRLVAETKAEMAHSA